MQFKNYSRIRLLTDKYASEGVTVGAIGTIIEVYEKPTPGYEVDFSDAEGTITAWFSVEPDEIELVDDEA
jgi:hypothetical protein